MSSPPIVTVLMPVYNGGIYLKEAIESILGQTFRDFELLIIDDGSTDGSYDLVAAYSDSRIRLVRQDKNHGLVASLNLGLTLARGKFVARMDADDISFPERLSRQVDFMDANPSVGICGSWLQTFSMAERTLWPSPLAHNEIHAKLLFESALYHPTVFIRKSLFSDQVLRYMEDFPCAEDYELWSRCVSHCRLANIGEVLLYYRIHNKSVGSREASTMHQSADMVRLGWLRDIGLHPTSDEIILHRQLSLWLVPIQISRAFLEQSHAWLLKIRYANQVSKIFPEPELSKELSTRWFVTCCRSTSFGPTVFAQFYRSPLSRYFSGKKRDLFALAAKSFLCWSGR